MLNFSAKTLIRKDYINLDGKTSIFIQVIIGSKKTRIPLHLKCKPSQFLNGQLLPIDGMPKKLARDYNMIIGKEMAKVNDLCIISRLNGIPLTIKQFREKFASYDKLLNFITFCTDYKQRAKGLVSEGTIESYRQTIMHLSQMKSAIYFNEINLEMIEDFEIYMKKRKMRVSTRGKHHKNLKMFITRAITKGVAIKHPYSDFVIKSSKTIRSYLTIKEIDLLEDLWRADNLSGHLQNTLTAFLFACKFGGLRLSDIKAIEHKNIVADHLVFTPKKTQYIDKMVSVPLTPNYRQYIKTDYDILFPLPTEQKINLHLKILAELVGIAKSISFHFARHSFGTNYIESGGEVTALKEIMGHSKLDTTLIYVHMANSKRAREGMVLLNQRIIV